MIGARVRSERGTGREHQPCETCFHVLKHMPHSMAQEVHYHCTKHAPVVIQGNPPYSDWPCPPGLDGCGDHEDSGGVLQ